MLIWDHCIEKLYLFVVSILQTRFYSFIANIQLQRYFSVSVGLLDFV